MQRKEGRKEGRKVFKEGTGVRKEGTGVRKEGMGCKEGRKGLLLRGMAVSRWPSWPRFPTPHVIARPSEVTTPEWKGPHDTCTPNNPSKPSTTAGATLACDRRTLKFLRYKSVRYESLCYKSLRCKSLRSKSLHSRIPLL
jgi:hypothetical protein